LDTLEADISESVATANKEYQIRTERINRAATTEKDNKETLADVLDKENFLTSDRLVYMKQINEELSKSVGTEEEKVAKTTKLAALNAKISSIDTELVNTQSQRSAAEEAIAGAKSEQKLNLTEQNKIVLDILNKQFSLYNTMKEQYNISKMIAGTYRSMIPSISKQMQLTGEINKVAFSGAIDASREKLNKQIEDAKTVVAEGEKVLKNKTGTMSEEDRGKVKSLLGERGVDIEGLDDSGLYKKYESEIKNIDKERIDAQNELMTLFKEEIGLHQTNKELAAADVTLSKQHVALFDALGVGIQASAAMRMQVIKDIGANIEQNKNQQLAAIDAIKKAEEEGKRNLEAEKELKNLKAEELSLMQQQLEASKAMREGWTSALNAMTIASGRVTKIMISQKQNLGVGLRELGMTVSNVSGSTKAGAGGTESSKMKVNEDGGLSMVGKTNYYQTEAGIDPEELRKVEENVIRGKMTDAAEQAEKALMKQHQDSLKGNGAARAGQTPYMGVETAPGKPGSRKVGESPVDAALKNKGVNGAQEGSGSNGVVINMSINVTTGRELDDALSKLGSVIRKKAGFA
jgi:chorismate mutase